MTKQQMADVERCIVENFKEGILSKNELHAYILGMRSFAHATTGNMSEIYGILQHYLNNFDELYRFYTTYSFPKER